MFSDEEKIVSRIEVSTAFSAKMYYGHLLPSILVTIYDYKGERYDHDIHDEYDDLGYQTEMYLFPCHYLIFQTSHLH